MKPVANRCALCQTVTMRILTTCLFLFLSPLVPLPAIAEVLDGPAFDARVTGKTITYSQLGGSYGEEQYLPGNRVIWAFEDGECQLGKWYEKAGHICFLYNNREEEQCWVFRDEGGRLSALIEGGRIEETLYAEEVKENPIQCPLPGLGV